MKDDYILHLERTVTHIVADSDANRLGVRASLDAGGNRLSVESSGGEVDDKKLLYNDEEVLTTATLRAQTQATLNELGTGPSTLETDTVGWAGTGSAKSPFEPIVKIPPASETEYGIVKVVNEGSHGYPCPGFGGQNFYVGHRGGNNYYQLRNGADDLETDVFFTEVTLNPWKVTPTANRFRPARLPVTAKPIAVRHGTEDCLWLDTTDGTFILLTGGSKDPDTWRCLKVTNSDMALGYYGYPHLYNGKIYVVYSLLNQDTCEAGLWEATVTAANTLTFTRRPMTGTNINGTEQTGTVYKLFDAIKGTYPSTKCMMTNKDTFHFGTIPTLQRDQLVQFRKGNKVRVAHINNMQADSATTYIRATMPVSYELDLLTGIVTPDDPDMFPVVVSKDGFSHSIPRTFMNGAGGLYTLCAVPCNGYVFTFDTYESLGRPVLRALTPIDMDAYESLRGINHYWTRVAGSNSYGMYASPIESRPKAPKPLSGNRMMVEVSNIGSVLFEYDPAGSYGPNAKGYGPSNNRVVVPTATAVELGKVCWVFDGGDITHNGGWLSRDNLTAYTTYENDVFGSPISMTQAYYDTLLQAALDKYSNEKPTDAQPLFDAAISVVIHRVPGVPMLGMLQTTKITVLATGRKTSKCYVFKITSTKVTGNIDSIVLGELLTERVVNTTMKTYSATARNYYIGGHLYKLRDGGWVVAIGGVHEGYVGSSNSPSMIYVFDAAGVMLASQARGTNTPTAIVPFGTKELGYGIMYTAPSAEGMYLDSFGHTTADVVKCMNNQATPVRNIIVMSRTDAGDNVVVSQLAVTDVRDKVVSLIPPTRRVQGMDLSQDRTITKSMIAGSTLIPNQRDLAYPVQQQHRNSLVSKALKTHTHVAGDFVTDAATVGTYGVSKLGNLASEDATAFRVDAVKDLTDSVTALQERQTQLVKLDNSIAVDYEV